MEQKNQTITISLLTLIVGLLVGYFFGVSATSDRDFTANEFPHEDEMMPHMSGDDIVDNDGELRHMMDEMMLIGRGQTGEAYEEAWLRGMIVHHLGAIEMSETLLEETDRPELIELANNIIASQSTEVEQMKTWLRTWFNGNER